MHLPKDKIKIAVLLSSYNGERFIEEQISSLLNLYSKYDIDIHIRDDGSADGTKKIIKEITKKNSNIFLYEGCNVGVINSFLWLVEHVRGYEYYAFCDQDDVWEPLKIIAAVNMIENNNRKIPLIYCSAYSYVDHNLGFIGRFESQSDFSIQNLLIENCAPGCTMVFNSLLREKYCNLNLKHISQRIVMHDWFFLLLGLGFGKVLYDKNSYLLYRQHANNVIGKKSGFYNIIKSKIKQFIKESKRPKHLLYLQAKLLAECCIEIPDGEIHRLSNLFVVSQNSLLSRIKFVLGGNIKRVKRIDDAIFKILFIFGYYR
ncbi:glycosyltransferase [Hafnia alvei]|uniref:glycosyltransferase n=1 Tax=Hafnia alvei TaxID=569 RepID=UPI00396C2CFB